MIRALFALSLLALPLSAQTGPVVKVEGMKDTFRQGDIFVAGQPSLETLRALKEQGVKLVVNVRDEKEMKDFAATSYNEEAVVKELGMAYLWLPLPDRAAYTPALLERLGAAVKATPGKVLIHCAVGGRATTVYIAHLVRHRGQSLDEAAAAGRQMRFSFPVEDLLGGTVSFHLKDRKP